MLTKQQLDDYIYGDKITINLVNKKENNMTDTQTLDNTPVTFEITEKVVQTGYVNKDGKFVPADQAAPADAFVQTGEDAQ